MESPDTASSRPAPVPGSNQNSGTLLRLGSLLCGSLRNPPAPRKGSRPAHSRRFPFPFSYRRLRLHGSIDAAVLPKVGGSSLRGEICAAPTAVFELPPAEARPPRRRPLPVPSVKDPPAERRADGAKNRRLGKGASRKTDSHTNRPPHILRPNKIPAKFSAFPYNAVPQQIHNRPAERAQNRTKFPKTVPYKNYGPVFP